MKVSQTSDEHAEKKNSVFRAEFEHLVVDMILRPLEKKKVKIVAYAAHYVVIFGEWKKKMSSYTLSELIHDTLTELENWIKNRLGINVQKI